MVNDSEVVAIETTQYDATEDLKKLFPDAASLENLDTYLTFTNSYKIELDADILQNQSEYEEYLASDDTFDKESAQLDLQTIINEINENKELSLNTQNVIGGMTSSIKRLDEAKKNLVLTMTVLKRLHMLVHAYDQLEALAHEKRYTEVVTLLDAVAELIEHFKSYKSIDEVAKLTKRVHHLKIKLADQIFKDFEVTFNGQDPISEVELTNACKILDLLGQEYHDRLINWFCNQQLKEIKSIFASNDEAGSLDNLNRRFIFFKKVLKNCEANYDPYFPKEWKIEEELTLKFSQHTKESIKQVLSRSGKNTNVDTLLNSLQQTLDFEKYLNNHFRYITQQDQEDSSYVEPESKFTHSIATVFEPFLGIWVENQNSFLNEKFMGFLSQSKLPDDHHDGSTNVIPSSADLFRIYRHLLTQCSNLSTGSPLKDLSKLFSKWAIEYSNKVLKPTLPPSINDNEGILYVTLVLNTADYCSTTITQLEEKLIEIIDEPFKSSINLDKAKESFIKSINSSINLLLGKIDQESDFAWREMANANWAHVEEVGDQSRYVSTLKDILTTNCCEVLPKLSRDVYVRSFCDKIVELITNQFLANVVKIKPIPVIAAEQMLLDLSVLKSIFLKLPSFAIKDPKEETSVSSQYQKHVDKLVNKLEIIFKLLLTQDAPQEGLVANYFFLIRDRSVDNFVKILKLKGITNSNKQSKLIELFKIHMKAHDDLMDNSPILSKLSLDTSNIHSSLPHSPIPSGIMTPKIKSPLPEGANSPRFENILKKDNIEKGLKELGFNSETGVNKLNENFQKFGRFFNRNNSTADSS